MRSHSSTSNSLLLISKSWHLAAVWWCSRMLKLHFSLSMQEHQFPLSPPPMTTLLRWIGFKYNLGYCQMWFTGYFLMVHPLISVLFSLFRPHRITSFSLWGEKCFFFSYKDVKCCQNKAAVGREGEIKGRGRELQYALLTAEMDNSTLQEPHTVASYGGSLHLLVAAGSKWGLEIVQSVQLSNLPWLSCYWINMFFWEFRCLVKDFFRSNRFHPSVSIQNYLSFSHLNDQLPL